MYVLWRGVSAMYVRTYVLCRYAERIDVVETRIAAHLRDQLGTAKNANEMFRIFSRYNALFVRPHIQGAIREYQTQLIQRVKEDIDGLHQKFKVQSGCICGAREPHLWAALEEFSNYHIESYN